MSGLVSMNVNFEERVNWSMRGSIRRIRRQLSRLALDQMSYIVAPLGIRTELWHKQCKQGRLSVFQIKSHSALVSSSKHSDSSLTSEFIYLHQPHTPETRLTCLALHTFPSLHSFFLHDAHTHSHTLVQVRTPIFSSPSLQTCNNVWAGKCMLMCLSLVV